MRDCLELLRENIPFSDKMTTLSLLQSARRYIVVMLALFVQTNGLGLI